MFIDMASTHGGIDQANSATFVMTSIGKVVGIEIARRPALKRIANGAQVSDGIVRSNGSGVKILSFR